MGCSENDVGDCHSIPGLAYIEVYLSYSHGIKTLKSMH